MSHRALHLLPGKAVRRPPTLCSAKASAAPGTPAGSFIWLWLEVPGTQFEAHRSTVRERKLCGSVSSEVFSHRHRARYHDFIHPFSRRLSFAYPTSCTFPFFTFLSPAFSPSQHSAQFPASSFPCPLQTVSFPPRHPSAWSSAGGVRGACCESLVWVSPGCLHQCWSSSIPVSIRFPA